MRVGVLGGTFDPIHYGHLLVAEEARLQLQLDRVLFVPAGQPWLKAGQTVSPVQRRVEMVRLAVESNPFFEVCLDEVDRPGPTYTVDTLRSLKARMGPGTLVFFILGADAMANFHLWKEPERLLELSRWVVVERPGYRELDVGEFVSRYPGAAEAVEFLSVPVMGVSGADIRRRAAAGMPLRYQVPEAVANYVERYNLYAGGAPTLVCPRGKLLELAIERGALKYGRFTLSSGRESGYYFDGRLISLDPQGARAIAAAMLPLLRASGVEAVGGLTLGADPIVAAVSLASSVDGEGIPGFIVRKEAKAHGTGQSIEGPLRPGSRVAIVDDVCTSGGSLFQAIEAAEAAGCRVVKVAAVLDRVEGGSEELRRRGYDFTALLRANAQGTIEVAPPGIAG